MTLRNWAGNYAYSAETLHAPDTLDELRDVVRGAERVKVLGTRHSFNAIADTEGALVTIARLPPVFEVDDARRTVTVDAGATYGRVCGALAREGLALHNMASLPHISIAGACATGTHGSGDRNAGLAAAIAGLELMTADGETVTLDRDDPRLAGAAVGLGALGVVTRVTLDVVPAFDVAQTVYEDLPLARLDGRFDELMASGYSVSLFTDWHDAAIGQVWVKRRVDDGADAGSVAGSVAGLVAELLGAAPARDARHPIPGASAVHCTPQLGARGPAHERLPHFRMDFTPSSGAELQADYLVPRAHAWPALLAIAGLRERVAPLLQIAEVRTVAADELWMSPSHGHPCVSFHFTWKPDWPAVRALLPAIEAELLPLGARPHWGKLFTAAPGAVHARYERLGDFRALVGELDPGGKFANAFLSRYVLG